MGRRKIINQDTIIKLVCDEMNKLPDRYVTVLKSIRSKGVANVNVGGTKFELNVSIYDTNVDDWTKAPRISAFTFEDSEGIGWWDMTYNNFKMVVKTLCENS